MMENASTAVETSNNAGATLRKRTTPVLASSSPKPRTSKLPADLLSPKEVVRLAVPQLSTPIPYLSSPATTNAGLYGIIDNLLVSTSMTPQPTARSPLLALTPGQPSQSKNRSLQGLATPHSLPLPASPCPPIPYVKTPAIAGEFDSILSPVAPLQIDKENVPLSRVSSGFTRASSDIGQTSEYSGGMTSGSEVPLIRPTNIRKVNRPPPAPSTSRTSSSISRRSSLLSSQSGWPSTASSRMARTESQFSDSSTYSQGSSRDSLFTRYSKLAPSTATSNSIDSSLKFTQKFADKHASKAKGRAMKLSRSIHKVEVDRSGSEIPKLWAQLDEQAEAESEAKEAWRIHKWVLLISVSTLFIYGLTGLSIALLTWLRTWNGADVVLIGNRDLLIYLTLASVCCLITSLLGLTGTILNSRPILAFYNVLLWPTLVAVLVVGYSAYKKEHHMLDRKLNQLWSQSFDDLDRLRIQNTLHCCGYYNALHDATFSKRCYPRTNLPGCKSKLLRFEHGFLRQTYRTIFSLVPLHITNIFVAVLCANHVNNMFGKGFTPSAYRLNITDVRQSAIDILRTLPSTSSRQTTRRRGSSVSSRAESLVSMPHSESGLLGLGLREEDEAHQNRT